jgi:hypothetical protein
MEGTLYHPLDADTTQPQDLVSIPSELTTTPDDPGGATVSTCLRVLWECCHLFGRLYCHALGIIRRLRVQITELRCQAHYWQAQHQRAVQREANLKEDKQRLQARIRDLKRRLFGRKSETSSTQPKAKAALPTDASKPRRGRGQQAGSKGHGRRSHDHLPAEDESCTLPGEQRCCPYCQEPFEEISGTADGDILEVEVRSHRRRYHRQRYRRH